MATKPLLRPRITRICLRDLIFCMEQEREMKYSRALYLALLKWSLHPSIHPSFRPSIQTLTVYCQRRCRERCCTVLKSTLENSHQYGRQLFTPTSLLFLFSFFKLHFVCMSCGFLQMRIQMLSESQYFRVYFIYFYIYFYIEVSPTHLHSITAARGSLLPSPFSVFVFSHHSNKVPLSDTDCI